MFKLIKAVFNTVLDMIYTVFHDKPLIIIGATFPEKLTSHHSLADFVGDQSVGKPN